MAWLWNNDWSIVSRNRVSMNSGRFVAPFTASYGTLDGLMQTIAGITGDTTAAGVNDLHAIYTDGTPANVTDAQIVHVFDFI